MIRAYFLLFVLFVSTGAHATAPAQNSCSAAFAGPVAPQGYELPPLDSERYAVNVDHAGFDLFETEARGYRREGSDEDSVDALDRLVAAREILGDVSPEDFAAILRAHDVPPDANGKYSRAALRTKLRILADAGITGSDADALLRRGVCGTLAPGSAPTATRDWRVTSERVGHSVSLNADATFSNTQAWVVRNATRDELLEAARRLRLTGRYGIYGDSPLMATQTDVANQNQGGTMQSHGTRPAIIPPALGSTAFAIPQPNGRIDVGMRNGPLGMGGGYAMVGDTRWVGGVPETPVYEVGRYGVSFNGASAASRVMNAWLNFTPPGLLTKAVANLTMGQLHNHVFRIADALAHIVEDDLAASSH